MSFGIYDTLRTPYFNIEIGKSDGSNMVPLPAQLQRLVQKIEISENLANCSYNSMLTITFIEGSREPFVQDGSVITTALYGADEDSGDNLANSSGFLPDLQFSQKGTNVGITSTPMIGGLTNDTKKATAPTPTTGAEASQVSQFKAGVKTASKRKIRPPQAPSFIFEERNQLKITWGYKEDATSERTVRGYITNIQCTFPENAQPTTVVTCLGPKGFLDQKTTGQGKKFFTTKTVINDPELGAQVLFEDVPTSKLIKDACKAIGVNCIVSDNLTAETIDNNSVKVWPAGESLDQFFRTLASRHNAYYTALVDPKTGKDTIVFLTRKDFEKTPIINNKNLTTYKGHNSILKTVTLRVAFDLHTGRQKTGIDDKGNVLTAAADSGEEEAVLFTKQSYVDTDATSHNPVALLKGAMENLANPVKGSDGKNTNPGKVEYDPSASLASLELSAKTSADCAMQNLVVLDFTTMGYTKLTPGTVYIGGVGDRFSGYYNVLNVTHIIDEKGYSCRATGSSRGINIKSGISDSSATKGEDIDDSTESLGLFSQSSIIKQINNPATIGSVNAVSNEDTKGLYNKLLGIV